MGELVVVREDVGDERVELADVLEEVTVLVLPALGKQRFQRAVLHMHEQVVGRDRELLPGVPERLADLSLGRRPVLQGSTGPVQQAHKLVDAAPFRQPLQTMIPAALAGLNT